MDVVGGNNVNVLQMYGKILVKYYRRQRKLAKHKHISAKRKDSKSIKGYNDHHGERYHHRKSVTTFKLSTLPPIQQNIGLEAPVSCHSTLKRPLTGNLES